MTTATRAKTNHCLIVDAYERSDGTVTQVLQCGNEQQFEGVAVPAGPQSLPGMFAECQCGEGGLM